MPCSAVAAASLQTSHGAEGRRTRLRGVCARFVRPAFQVVAPASRFTRLQPLHSFGAISSQPFSMPKAPAPARATPSPPTALTEDDLPEWRKLGMSEEVLQAVQAMGFQEPSAIQKLAMPEIFKGDDIAFSAATGSGKTLAYLLPIMQLLKSQEQEGKARQSMRPRALILVPTRELVGQVLETTKGLSHVIKVSSCGLHGGEDWGAQRRKLQGEIDIVVASPGRLLQHYEKGHLFFSQITHVVIDEMDTMLKDGFGPDLKKLLTPLEQKSKRDRVQYLMSTATLTPAVKRLMEDEGFPTTRFLQSSDAHKSLPNMKHVMIDTKGTDKVQMLIDVLYESRRKGERVMVFCNTVSSCRAVEHALKEVSLDSICYHGDMHSDERHDGLQNFKDGKVQFMVCTDVAARGLDLPLVEHVIMFDFPLNPIEYLHRSGRTARMGAKGKVTSLLQKRDKVLAAAIQSAVARGLPLDSLSARKKDYEQGGKLSSVITGKPSAPRKSGNRHASAGKKRSSAPAPKGKGGKPLLGAQQSRGRPGGVGAAGRFGKARPGRR